MIVYLLIFHSITMAGSILDSEEAELTKIRPLVFNMLVIEWAKSALSTSQEQQLRD